MQASSTGLGCRAIRLSLMVWELESGVRGGFRAGA